VNFANTTRATLRYGLPQIDFTAGHARLGLPKDAVPVFCAAAGATRGGAKNWSRPQATTLHSGRYEREFAVLNELSSRMTDYALNGIGKDGEPARPQWAQSRSNRDTQAIPSCESGAVVSSTVSRVSQGGRTPAVCGSDQPRLKGQHLRVSRLQRSPGVTTAASKG